jgi:hypothetical protein
MLLWIYVGRNNSSAPAILDVSYFLTNVQQEQQLNYAHYSYGLLFFDRFEIGNQSSNSGWFQLFWITFERLEIALFCQCPSDESLISHN